MVHFNHVTKLYDNKIVSVNDITFQIEEGEFVFLIGPSGSGKTTVIKMLIRDEVPTYGKVYFKDKDITTISRSKVYKLRREIGVIFQDYKLIPDKTAFENVAFAMEAAGKSNAEIKETVPYVLDIVGLSHRMEAFPRQLSGGEQQRVAIARAIANNPKILIADEPTGNLDPASAWDIVQILSKINNWGTTVIMSTHGTDIVNSLNKRVIQMHGGNIIRDDNKGQYEMTAGYEDKMRDDTEITTKKEKSKKKTFQVSLPKNENEGIKGVLTDKVQKVEDTNNEIENVVEEKQGFFSKVMSKLPFKKNPDEDYETEPLPSHSEMKEKVEDNNKVEVKEEVKEKDEKIKRPLNVDHTDEGDNNKIEEVKPAEPEEIKEAESQAVVTPEVKVEEDKSKKTKKTGKFHLSLAKDRSQPEPEIEVPVVEETLKKSEKKTPVRKLNLPKVVLEDIKAAGYKYIEQIIEDGPEGLSKKITIDPEEVIIIANEIKRYSEENN